MQEIKAKLDELEQLLNNYKPTSGEQRAFSLINSYVSLAVNAASFKSRVNRNPNTQKQAAKLNPNYKDHKPKAEPKKKRGRPKKVKENVLASSATPKTLTEKLKND